MILVLEINEFNFDLLKQMAKDLNLVHVNKLLELYHYEFNIEDKYESDFLEPWSQWVSLHTGLTTKEHKIKHLGDAPKIQNSSLWEKMADLGFSVGVWGVMNGLKGPKQNIKFFMPDPWTFSEPGHPNEIKNLLMLPRYLSKNYLNINWYKIIKMLPHFIYGLKCVPFKFCLIKEIFKTIYRLLKYKFSNFVFINFFDYITALAFLKLKNKYKTQFNIFFMNSVAHSQHHYWENKSWIKLQETFKNLNQILGFFWTDFSKEDLIFVTNGLSQRPRSLNEKPWILYRQKNPTKFFKVLNLEIILVEQLMTHDSHLFFESKEKSEYAFNILNQAKINGESLFVCEKDTTHPERLFIRLNFFDPVNKNDTFNVGLQKFNFLNHFNAIVTRTGYHIPKANLLTNILNKPNTFNQPEIFNFIVNSASQRKIKK